jgi:hypothetical protein
MKWLRAFINPGDASWHISMVASMFLVVPILILFFIGQPISSGAW